LKKGIYESQHQEVPPVVTLLASAFTPRPGWVKEELDAWSVTAGITGAGSSAAAGQQPLSVVDHLDILVGVNRNSAGRVVSMTGRLIPPNRRLVGQGGLGFEGSPKTNPT